MSVTPVAFNQAALLIRAATVPSIELVDRKERFYGLRRDWDRLLEHAQHTSIFSSWEWQALWWKHYGNTAELRILVAKSGEHITGILPLYIRNENVCGVRTRVLRLIGTGGDTSPDYLGPLLAREAADAVCDQLVDYLCNQLHGWDIAQLVDIHPGTNFAAAVQRYADHHGYACFMNQARHILTIKLPTSWNQYLAKFDRDRRNRIRRLRRKLETDLGARFYVWDDGQALKPVIAQLIALHRLRWKNRENGGAFRSQAYVGLHSELIHACFERGWLRLYCLEINQRLAAIYYCYRFRNEIFYFQSGFDPAFEAYSPGQALLGFAVEHAIGEGNQIFDLLKGDHHYKSQWANSSRETTGVAVYRPTLAGRMAKLRWQTAPTAGRTLKHWMGVGTA